MSITVNNLNNSAYQDAKVYDKNLYNTQKQKEDKAKEQTNQNLQQNIQNNPAYTGTLLSVYR